MAKYLLKHEIQDLIHIRNIIFPEREKAYKKYLIDVLDNDTLSSLQIYEIVSEYDDSYNINFSRNGEDAQSNGINIEHKCSNIKPTKKDIIPNAAFQFHAMGNLEYQRYIFVVRRKDTLFPVRLYDISNQENVKIVIKHLLSERHKWLEKGRLNEVKNMKRDVITLPETLIQNKLKINKFKVIKNCQVFKD